MAPRFPQSASRTATGESETLPADLVVEASGRGNLTLDLLESTRPTSSPKRPSSGSTSAMPRPCSPSRTMRRPTGRRHDVRRRRLEGGLAGIMLPLERNRWIVTLVGRHGDKPPGDWDGFLAYAQQLRTPTIYQCDQGCRATGRDRSLRLSCQRVPAFRAAREIPARAASVRRRDLPLQSGLWSGMSVAAQEACLLRELLQKRAEETDPLDGLAPAFFAEAAKLIETPWALAAIPDYAVPETEGQSPGGSGAKARVRSGHCSARRHGRRGPQTVDEVLHLLKPQSVLRDPDLVERVKALAAQASGYAQGTSRPAGRRIASGSSQTPHSRPARSARGMSWVDAPCRFWYTDHLPRFAAKLLRVASRVALCRGRALFL